MASVLHRTTKRYLESVDPVQHLVADWIHFPDLSAVAGFPKQYWIINGDAVSLMDQSARDAVDAANVLSRREGVFAEMDDIESLIRATAVVVRDEINLLRTEHGLPLRTLAQVRSGIRSKLGAL